jgi:hypothetical protein
MMGPKLQKKYSVVGIINLAFGHDYPFSVNPFVDRKGAIRERRKVAILAAKFLKVDPDDVDLWDK